MSSTQGFHAQTVYGKKQGHRQFCIPTNPSGADGDCSAGTERGDPESAVRVLVD